MRTEPRPGTTQDAGELAELLAEALRRRDEGRPLDLDRLAGDRPHVAAALRDALSASGRVQTLHESIGTGDGRTSQRIADRYELTRRIGAGAMGVAYAALDHQLERPVAVKLLRSHLLIGEHAEARLEREAKALGALRHPAIVTVHDHGRTDEGDPFVVLDLLDGANLAELIEEQVELERRPQDGDLPEHLQAVGYTVPEGCSHLALIVGWMASIADGLQAAHDAGIVHRDVKPSNVFVTREGQAVLLDFGLARAEDVATLTRSDASLGTPAYLAPEALGGMERPSPSVDVYGAAATLYHLVTWRPPYRGTASQVLAALSRQDPPRADRLAPGLPRDLQAILDRGLARDPARRYASAAALADDLRAFLAHRPVQARPTTALSRAWRRARRSNAVRAGLGVALLAALLVVGVQANRRAAANRKMAEEESLRPIPAILGLGSAHLRTYLDPEVRAHFEATLDRAVERASSPLPTSLLRGVFRLDHGDPRGAAADLAYIARSLDTDYSRELSKRYAALPADADGHAALDLTDLPAPVAPLDRYLAAFHARRANSTADVSELLDDPELADFAPAAELLTIPQLLVLSRSSKDPVAVEQADETLHELVAVMETATGGPSAASTGILSSAYLLQSRHEDVLDAAGSELETWPFGHRRLVNTARSYWMLRDPGRAEENYRAALRVLPESLREHELLARVQLFAGDLERAWSSTQAAPFPEDSPTRETLLGDIQACAALNAVEQHLLPVAFRRADDAAEHYDNARALSSRYRQRTFELLARGILEYRAVGTIGDELERRTRRAAAPLQRLSIYCSSVVLRLQAEVGFRTTWSHNLIALLLSDSINPRRLTILGDWLPPKIDSALAGDLRDLLRKLEGIFPSRANTSSAPEEP